MPARALSRKEAPGLTFVFSLPDPARSPSDFSDLAPCRLWKPSMELIQSKDGLSLFSATGQELKRLTYKEGPLVVPFKDLKNACINHGNAYLPGGTIFEVRLALPMGLDDRELTINADLWRIGYVHLPEMTAHKERQGIREKFGYYLLAKRIAGGETALELPASIHDSNQFLGAERLRWSDRFRTTGKIASQD